MYFLKVYIQLFLKTFSLRRDSLRFITPKRVVVVLSLYPLILLLFTVNWLFLLLDELIFPFYRKREVKNALFIIGIPRSATTYLFSLLFRDEKNFHGFKLWELIFAPSICQKYIFGAVKWVDDRIGNPVYRLSLWLDKKVFGEFRAVHDIGLTKPEEDEVLFLYNFSSLFLYFFYPELPQLENFLYHDMKVPLKVRMRNIRFYYRCVQRHNYYFDKDNSKYFISKSPTFIPKMESLALVFKDAKFIYPLRSPYQTIPSTISLNEHIYSNFCNTREVGKLSAPTRDLLLDWYVHAHRVLKETIRERGMTIIFAEIIGQTADVVKNIYDFLGLQQPTEEMISEMLKEDETSYKGKHIYDRSAGIDSTVINSRLINILPSELLTESI